MADQVKEFEELAARLESMNVPHAAGASGAGTKGDICAYWKIAKPFVEAIIAVLSKLPFKWAKTAAAGLQAVDDAMSKFCPA